ncbi:cupin domain-containing protein [Halobacteriales archaeon SW_8_65_20]|nr:MAG: cupin domain-containing protein [Halobacteriales archaeon QH_7_65_31]PSQ30845.1 MAG: cupin domain-containing protein [Halobacteriales archaeon SW_6_65_46]PSQ53125.1 MAG: cupin domain-containing protein [Halobacteriales archaeon SW_8_65_20]
MDIDAIGTETEAVEDVFLAQMASGEEMSVQHFRIEPGATVPKHDHHHEQAGFIYDGEATFRFADGSEETLGPGDSYVFEGGEVHGVENRGDEPFCGVDIFAPPRTDPDWGEE